MIEEISFEHTVIYDRIVYLCKTIPDKPELYNRLEEVLFLRDKLRTYEKVKND